MQKLITLILAIGLISPVFAKEGPVPKGVPPLDHVFIIMLENLGFDQIIGNPNAHFLNQYAKSANLGVNYFAIEHPSLPNYLDIIGGSNFGVQSDTEPDWHNSQCIPEIVLRAKNSHAKSSAMICPIAGNGIDAPNSSTLKSNKRLVMQATDGVTGKMLGDQLVESGRSWKSYQQNLPLCGADRVNFSDGFYTNLTHFDQIPNGQKQTLSQADLVMLYAVKHNPFAYFHSVQEGKNPHNCLNNVVGFEGTKGLFADLQSGDVPSLSFIAANQCNDMHGLGNAGSLCALRGMGTGSQAYLNPCLVCRGDSTVEQIVKAIHQSPVWSKGHNAIIVVWDEDDYRLSNDSNRVAIIVDTNYGVHELQSSQYYTHFSLLKSIEAGFALPCLNHACDETTAVMSDLFAAKHRHVG